MCPPTCVSTVIARRSKGIGDALCRIRSHPGCSAAVKTSCWWLTMSFAESASTCGVSQPLDAHWSICMCGSMPVRHALAIHACTGNTCMRWQYMHALAGPIRTRAQPPARGGGRLEIADYTMPSRCNVSTAVAKVNKRGRALLLSSGWVKRLKNTHRMQAALSFCMAIQRNHVTIRPCTSEGLCSRRPCTHNTRVGVEI